MSSDDEVEESSSGSSSSEDEITSFDAFDLDRRLAEAVAKQGFTEPTLVQSSAIPLFLEGRDMLVRARTGSGKTLAYALPLLQKILHAKVQGDAESYVRAVVLVPTKDLCQQLCDTLTKLVRFSNSAVKIVALVSQPLRVQQAMLAERPDVVVATPTQLLAHCSTDADADADGGSAAACDLSKLDTFVVDEADLVLSFGYIDDLRAVLRFTPKTCQSCLVSATISEDLDQLRRVILHRPAILRLKEAENADTSKLVQYYVNIGPQDKELLLYALLKLGLIKGKTIFFVNSVKQCYRFKLLLDLFDVRSAVLNAELPVNSRINIMSHFNRGSFDHLIATDESLVDRAWGKGKGGKGGRGGTRSDRKGASSSSSSSSASIAEEQKAYGAARGLDFHAVDTVVNIDFPIDEASYTHRIGRTARAGGSGTALSFIVESSSTDVAALARVHEAQPRSGAPGAEQRVQPTLLPLDMGELEVFRYRVTDAAKSVTGKAVHEARLKDLKLELLTSKRLAEHFEVRVFSSPFTLRSRAGALRLQSLQSTALFITPHLASPHLFSFFFNRKTLMNARCCDMTRSCGRRRRVM